MGAFFGAIAAASIGLSDLFGRRIVDRDGRFAASFILQFGGAAAAFVAALVIAGEVRGVDMVWGALSGLGLGGGIVAYYTGVPKSSATVVAPTVGTLSALLSFFYVIARGADWSWLSLGGGLVAILGLAIISTGEVDRSHLRTGIFWGVASGLCYAFGMSMMSEVSDESGVWPAVAQRGTAAAAIVIAALAAGAMLLPTRPSRGSALVGGLVTGLTSVMIIFGLMRDAPATTVTVSLFPAFSVLVGFFGFGDGVARQQVVGILLALLGVIGVVVG